MKSSARDGLVRDRPIRALPPLEYADALGKLRRWLDAAERTTRKSEHMRSVKAVLAKIDRLGT